MLFHRGDSFHSLTSRKSLQQFDPQFPVRFTQQYSSVKEDKTVFCVSSSSLRPSFRALMLRDLAEAIVKKSKHLWYFSSALSNSVSTQTRGIVAYTRKEIALTLQPDFYFCR